MSSRVVRVLLSVLVGSACGLVATSAYLVLAGDARPGAPDDPAVATATATATAPGGPPRSVPARARAVLRSWDAARARAWTTADAAALTRLYAPGSVAGRRDVTMLRAWTARGARVTELTTQVLDLRVVRAARGRLELVVTDRVARVRAHGVGADTTLPDDRPSTRRIVLVAARGSWRVASVSPEPPARS